MASVQRVRARFPLTHRRRAVAFVAAGLFVVSGSIAPAGAVAERATSPAGAGCQTLPAAPRVMRAPLHTNGRWILDAAGHRVTLAGVSWYGAEEQDEVAGGLDHQPVDQIAACIHAMGFNSVRLPFSDALVRDQRPLTQVAPELTARFQTANRRLLTTAQHQPARPIDVYTQVVHTLARHGVLVILDNHMTANDWCCGPTDGNSLWFDQVPGEHCATAATTGCQPAGTFTEADWITDWQTMARRFRDEGAVVGADLRNEVRPDLLAQPPLSAGWASGPSSTDWRQAATAAGDAVLAQNPHLLVIVEGVTFSIDLTGPASAPVSLSITNRLVWSPHTYPWHYSPTASELPSKIDAAWQRVLAGAQPTPIWVGEFGTDTATPAQPWLDLLLATLKNTGVSWCWWPLNGTQSAGRTRTPGARETYGLLDPTWQHPANVALSRKLATLARGT